ncbi:hypothetical protein [Natronorubrum thiooxidans]|uniref:Uncharacterized protein n=1 Tax=Natronorubrum thiooxidans TaxID=308853 RepID=A0A1N7F254_9EURY|nr:hypothetical protein [Natronorubrum thiooxidans]SIR94295.1 hypothetical protein SAMN05421752_105262 [Natronorubrum thiooxidans]
MLRRLRENGPIILVPLAWTFVTAVHLGLASEHALFIAHLVMAVIIVVFTALSWSAMDRGVLLAWRRVLLAGLVVTLAGGVGFLGPAVATPLFVLSLAGWMLIPAAGLAYTIDILRALKREDSTVGVRLRRFPGGNLRVCMLLVGTVSAW